MTDDRTDKAYDDNAASYSRDWLAQPSPVDMYALFSRWFLQGGRTADIGCGNGRDARWLAEAGYKVTGFDGAEALLREARKLFPETPFRFARLPGLAEIDETFDNVVCETVIMHLLHAEIPEALASLRRITKSGGVLYISWRVTEGEDSRQADGRLYSACPPDFILAQMKDCDLLHFEDAVSKSSGRRVCRTVMRKR